VGESVLVVRGSSLKAFFNVCRHRGCQLVLDGSGGSFGASGIRCPYHSWTYSLEGQLKSAPFLEDVCKADLPLYELGVATWGGFLFLHLDPAHAPPLEQQLGEVPNRLQRYPLADLRVGERLVYEVACNWKVILENYNECYHCAGVHPELCKVVPAFKHRGGSELDWDAGIPHRDGAWTFTHSGTTTRKPFPGLDEDEQLKHKGELLYPNFMVSLSADHVAAFTLFPRDPGRTTVACDFLFHPSETELDPSDAVDFWDLVNRQDWAICEGVQRGMSSRAFQSGFYAPMESLSLDIRRYVAEKLGP
jgi:Rieske 2Fe-2S family protein